MVAASPSSSQPSHAATAADAPVRLTSLAHGGGCGCKIAPDVLANLMRQMPQMGHFPDLLVGSDTADDAAVYRLNDEQALIATTDFFMPVVDDPYHFGQIAATNALSDIYAMGGQPIMALAILGMPINVLPHDQIAAIISGGADVCAAAGIPVAGGHSIDTVEPIYGLACIGLVHPQQIKRNATAQAGDVLILSKALGIGVFSAALKQGVLGDPYYAQMIASTTQLNTPGTRLATLPGIHAMTDVTGFGLLGHATEMARASGHDLSIDFAQLPFFDGVRDLAAQGFITGASDRNWQAVANSTVLADGIGDIERALLTDPQTSGGLLVSCAPSAADEVMALYAEAGFSAAAVIGEVGAASNSPQVTVR